MAKDYESYIADCKDDVAACIENMGCQPILFVGSGLSRRYFGGPSWEELLQKMAEQCPVIGKPFAYFKQAFKSYSDIGETFADSYREWAWGSGQALFPNSMFTPETRADAYLKFKVCEHLASITPKSADQVKDPALRAELAALQAIRPHAVITTNFDSFSEAVFSDYAPVIGQKILRHQYASVGEIFKIHGCVSDHASLVLTTSDYVEFQNKKKYLSAKLLAFFAEHPLLFVGYSANDENIKAILSDIDEILCPNGELIPNIYLVEWQEKITEAYPAREKLISVGGDRSVRVKSICASSFQWVFDAFAADEAAIKVNPKILRSLMARTYELVRHDLPSRALEVDFKVLEHAVSSTDELAKVYGITTLDNPSALNAKYPYLLTNLGEKLGGKGWHCAHKLIEQLRQDTGVDIKASDNRYHIAVKSGKTTINHKYSEDALTLLSSLSAGQEYTLEL
ncbi:SIR2 family protein [Magnetospirillum aberrantis]|uniref:SIR2 family protein n=1 Tax=Magnetospirillum aberrantis SpK TaxID=908842 RepID=A0A7C9QWK3_9PROT|nr:SIR2 family protein [Magnetospirillum aberrantis]NFV81899.1 SIR2 family protein [Magnetospirillum aberrantis SpK]